MSSPSSVLGAPAYAAGLGFRPSYRDSAAWHIKKFLAWVSEVTFGCAHRHVTLPFRYRQNCLDCGKSRLYILNGEPAVFPSDKIFKGLWSKSPLPASHARRHGDDGKIPGAAAPRAACCAGVDVPGVGFTHGADCSAQAGAVTRFGPFFFGGDKAPQPLPPSLNRALREELLIELAFAARILAESRIATGGILVSGHRYCRDCNLFSPLHTPDCHAGRVLKALAALQALPALPTDFIPYRKETAPSEEIRRAGDGTPSRAPAAFLDGDTEEELAMKAAAPPAAPGCLRDAVQAVRSVIYRAKGPLAAHVTGADGAHFGRSITIEDKRLAAWTATLAECDRFLAPIGGAR